MMDCIIYTGAVDKDGYGHSTYKGESTGMHRIVYVKAKGLRVSDIKGVVIRHTCDNRSCINPDHLIPGTHADNMNDMKVRGRAAKYEHNGQSKLTKEQVDYIRANAKPKDKYLGFAAIAKRFGVTTQTVWAIYRNINWR